MTPEGMKAVSELTKKGIKTNVTLIFSPLQALIAAKASATYVSPFIGRLDDIGHNGLEIISQIRTVFDNYGFETNILSAIFVTLSMYLILPNWCGRCDCTTGNINATV